jgi:hypothetical protein
VLAPLDGVGPAVGAVITIGVPVLAVDAVEVPILFVACTVATMRLPADKE